MFVCLLFLFLLLVLVLKLQGGNGLRGLGVTDGYLQQGRPVPHYAASFVDGRGSGRDGSWGVGGSGVEGMKGGRA